MAARDVLTLNESTPQIIVPQVGDTYNMPRALLFAGGGTSALPALGIFNANTGAYSSSSGNNMIVTVGGAAAIGFYSATGIGGSVPALIPANAAVGGATLGYAAYGFKQLYIDYTMTAAAATGNKTINKAAGSIRIAAAGTTVTLTNSLITANTIVNCYLGTSDATAKSVVNVAAAGSTVFTLNAATTAEVEIRWSLVSTD